MKIIMIIRYISIFYFISTFLLFAQNAYSETSHGLAMHGSPKYDKNFKHLDYVNPGAPKGGTIRFGVYGSYDNLN